MQYKYIGEGAGIPGLPHVVTDEEAAELGVSALLQQAIENGKYVKSDTPPDPTPNPFPKGKGSKRAGQHESEEE